MYQRLILGIGSGRCGTVSLAHILARQPDAGVSHEEPPLLQWRLNRNGTALEQRFLRWRRQRSQSLIGDVASFYLPYVEQAISLAPEIRIICLKRPREEVVESFCKWLARTNRLQINHWVERPPPGWHHDPIWTRIFPQYDIEDREQGIRRYWDEYYARMEELTVRFPANIRVFGTHEALNTEAGQRDLLTFAGVEPEKQILSVGTHENRSDAPRQNRRQTPRVAPTLRGGESPSPNGDGLGRPSSRRAEIGPTLSDPMDRRRCVVIVPSTGHIEPDCEQALRELERRGYRVWRVSGIPAMKLERSQLATNALMAGCEETMWIDADVGFHPDDVERLRVHQQPIVCGICPQDGKRSIACQTLPGTAELTFGDGGGLVEILHAGAGFLLVRREVYMRMQRELELPVCNERFGHPLVPYFQPMARTDEDGASFLAEDYSFSQRARDCGYQIMADTTIQLDRIGKYRYGWEDAGLDPDRHPTFTLGRDGQREAFEQDESGPRT